MRTTGTYRIVNPHDTPIRDVHVTLADAKALVAIDFGGQPLATYYEPIGYRIYRLAAPMQPGERREVTFPVDYHPRGTENGLAQPPKIGRAHVCTTVTNQQLVCR